MSRRWIFRIAVVGTVVVALLWWRGRRAQPPLSRPSEAIAVEPAQAKTGVRPAWVQPVDGGCPPGYPVKVTASSGIYHVPGGRSYDRTAPIRCYATAEQAEADGYRRAKA